jgi:hypothetical protein
MSARDARAVETLLATRIDAQLAVGATAGADAAAGSIAALRASAPGMQDPYWF